MTASARPPRARGPRITLGPDWLTWGVAALALGLAAVVIGLSIVYAARGPLLDPACAHGYARARTPDDSAVVDAVTVMHKDPSFRTCGSQRQGIAQRRASGLTGR